MSDTGKTIALIKTLAGKIDPSTIEQSVSDWLDDHPEATTTVEDGSITKAKLHSDLQDTVDDVSQLKNEVDDIEDEVYSKTLATASATSTGWKLKENGFCESNSSYKMDKYQVTAGDKVFVKSDHLFQFQPSASVPSGGTLNRIGDTYGTGEYTLEVPENATYLIVSTLISGSSAAVYLVSGKLSEAVDSINEEIDGIVDRVDDLANEVEETKDNISENSDGINQLVAKISQTDGNVVDTTNASITASLNLKDIPSIDLDQGVYFSNPFATTNTVILNFKPKDAEGNSINMTLNGQAASSIGENWGNINTFTVSELTVTKRSYSSLYNYEINWKDGSPEVYVLASEPDHWDVNGYARASDSNLNVGLTKGFYDDEYIAYSEPIYEWEPVRLLRKYPFVIANSENEFTDTSKIYLFDGNLSFHDGEKWTKIANKVKSNFLTIAHRGYGDPNLANALQSFINAANVGFRAVEIDCRQTSDGVYVAAHGDVQQLYSGGSQQTYTISETSWANLKGKTFDSSGLHPLTTVAQVFNTLRHHDMEYFVIDLKTGSNDIIMDLARRCGVADQIMLSYYSMDSLIEDISILKKYPSVAIRFTPSGTQAQYEQIREALPNMLYSDINVSESYAVLIPNSLSWNIPILCSGVQESTIKYMAPIAAGAMSQSSLQYSPNDFNNMIALNYNQFPSLSSDKQSVNLSVDETTTVTITSSIDDLPCYAFAYSSDLTVFGVRITALGETSTFTLTAYSQGSANLIVFTATGEQLLIPVTVT